MGGPRCGYVPDMFLLTALTWAASSWMPTCAAKDSPNLWFVFEGAPPKKDAPVAPDFVCPGLFFEDVVCGNSVGIGKVTQTSVNSLGQPTFELRYLPYGDLGSVSGFLNKEGGGVLYKPIYTPAVPSAAEPPPNPAELLRQYLITRAKASQPTQGVTLHAWTCPAASFEPPSEEMEPNGMKFRAHTARSAN